MKPITRRRLHALNLTFYAEHAAEFDATRERPWTGWHRVLGHLAPASDSARAVPLRLLDVGCGNARLASFLAERLARPLEYVGVDASEALLASARERCAGLEGARVELEQQDFLANAPGETLPAGPFDAVALFGVLHHVAGFDARRQLLEQAAARLTPGGVLVFTVWRFAESARLRGRIAAWGEERRAGCEPIDPQDLESGDHLLRWGNQADRLRYCHHADAVETDRLVEGLGMECLDRFDCDARTQSLNVYLVLRSAQP
jgi:SAM-dependent methyltransferase